MVVIVVRNQSHPPGTLTCGYNKLCREKYCKVLENGIFYM